MKNEITDISGIIGLASKLAALFVETTEAISKTLGGLEEDNVIKAMANAMKAQAAVMESELAILRRELAKTQSKVNEKSLSEPGSQLSDKQAGGESSISDLKKAWCEANESKVAVIEYELAGSIGSLKKHGSEQTDTKVRLPSDVSAAKTNRHAGLAEGDEKKTVASMETDTTEADQQAATGLKEEELQLLTAEARKSGFFDLQLEDVEAATFPNATDRIVFIKALSALAGQDTTRRMDAAKALAGIRHELSVRVLAGQMGHEQSAKVRQEYIRALAALNMKEGIAAVESALSDKAAQVRLVAVWCLYRLAGAESIPVMIRMLSDENEGVRRRAITCIGWLAREQTAAGTAANPIFRQAISSLIGCLKDPEKSVRIAVFGALEAITGKKNSEQLLTDENSHRDIIKQWKKWWTQQLFE